MPALYGKSDIRPKTSQFQLLQPGVSVVNALCKRIKCWAPTEEGACTTAQQQ